MNEKGFDLDALREAWTDPAAAPPVLDAEALARLRRDVAAGTRRLYAEVALETAGAAIGAAILFWLAATASGAGALAYAMVGVAILVGQAWQLRVRRDLWRATADAPSDYLQLQLRRSRVRGRLAALAILAGPAGVGVGLALQAFAPNASATALFDRLGTPGIVAVALAFVAMLAFAGASWRMERRRQARLAGLLAELDA